MGKRTVEYDEYCPRTPEPGQVQVDALVRRTTFECHHCGSADLALEDMPEKDRDTAELIFRCDDCDLRTRIWVNAVERESF